MQLSQAKPKELALLLHGLRAIYVADDEALRQKLMAQLVDELAKRGLSLPEDQPAALLAAGR